MSFTIYQQKKVCYTDQGNGPALVLIHGFMESKFIWERFAASLQESFRVICIDLPGHGDTEWSAEVYPLNIQAECIQTVLNAAGVEKCVIIGHSMGGYVVLQFAQQYPEMIQGFGLFHSQAAADSEHTKEFRDRTIVALNSNHTAFVTQFVPDLFATGNAEKFPREVETLVAGAKNMKTGSIIASQIGMRDRESLLPVLENATCPVMFILGKYDTKANIPKVLAQSLIPNHSEVLVIPSGHMGFYECEKETLSFVKSFTEHCFN